HAWQRKRSIGPRSIFRRSYERRPYSRHRPQYRRQVRGRRGTAQDLYGQTAEVARDTAVTFEKWLRDTIETKPYVAVAVALGIGWLIGRTHRPL
ncbi:MAG TPA: hypothetical protein VG099_13885, partial [Gemmataceae bacterium]|nr:hypothetical protein [Gemmataceae bacterium]